ncbi:MAG: hypothetical protein OEY11_00840 [Gammaproteobacteria bacterium]|nr:hypothetical protein [Gammaproteobacteria bacterium]
MRSKVITAIGILGCLLTGSANAQTADFSTLPGIDQTVLATGAGATYYDDASGLSFTLNGFSSSFGTLQVDALYGSGNTRGLQVCDDLFCMPGDVEGVTIKKSDGSAFVLKSLWIKDPGLGGSSFGQIHLFKGGSIYSTIAINFAGSVDIAAQVGLVIVDKVQITANNLYYTTLDDIVFDNLPVNTVLPVISGTALVGNTLTASTGTWTDADSDTLSYSYQWKADSSPILAATSNSYTPSSNEAHKAITVTVSANDGNGGIKAATSTYRHLTNSTPINTVLPVISGTALVGNTLTASTGTWTDADSDALTYSYQWQANGSNIAAATTSSYQLSSNEAHKTITVIVTANDAHAGIIAATSAGRTLTNNTPINTVLPVISGTALVGNTLTASTGTWTDADSDALTYSYQWQANGSNIAAATTSSYQLSSNEAHKTITVIVTANDAHAGIIAATSAGRTVTNSAPVNTVLSVISGTALVGNTLTTSAGTWADTDSDTLSVSYQWQANGVNLSGAVTNSYTLSSNEAHKTITVIVTANDGNGGIKAATSVGRTVTNSAPVNTVLPVISGTALVGNTLTASTGTWTDADSDTLSYSYQWKVDGSAILAATSNSYTLSSYEAHKTITVIVTANDANAGIIAATSAGRTVTNSAPVNTVLPVISGTALFGNVLTTSAGTWTDTDSDTLAYSYQWQANSSNIFGATSSSYLLSINEMNKTIKVVVTANDGNGASVDAGSSATTSVDLDTDGDGIGNNTDTDDDADGIPDIFDAFPLDPAEHLDTDNDGMGNNTDFDDDNDTVLDADDAFPLDASESVDTDADGVGDNADPFPNDATESVDSDGDGVGDSADKDDDNDGLPDNFETLLGLNPLNANDANYDLDADGYNNLIEYVNGSGVDDINSTPAFSLLGADSDGDGIPDLADAFPLDASEFIDSDGDGTGNRADSDDDNDGVSDNLDGMPLDVTETVDADGDNVGDNADAFPSDPAESLDTDADGTGNNADMDDDNDGVLDSEDAFPLDATESLDSDGDGVGDNSDAFPFDASEIRDTDGDGVGDNADIDTDGDGVNDNQDAFPEDAMESVDTDGDGVGDNADLFPTDAAESLDTDNDGLGNNADTDDDADGVEDSLDAFPLDSTESLDTDNDGLGNNTDSDDDGDGVPDSADAFPLDATETIDTDGDGIGDNTDALPLDATQSVNTNAGGGAVDPALPLLVAALMLYLRRRQRRV